MKNIKKLLIVFLLSGCFGFQKGDISNADVFHWENDKVTIGQFVVDHKQCLGVYGAPAQQSSWQKMLLPFKPYTVPQWDSIWATFENRDTQETGQRIAYSVPSNSGYASPSSYRKCMMKRDYYLVEYSNE